MRNAALVLLVTSLAGTWFLSPSKEKRKAEAVKHCLAALSQIEELDHTYSQRDFTSFEGTKEYFFRLARIVLDSVDAHGSPTKALNKAETTIQKAQLHRAEHPELRTALDWVTAKYLDVVHGIMKDCAETIHEGLKMEAPREGIGASVIVTLLTACDVVVKLSFAVNTVDEKVLENITIEEFVARREKASQKQPSGELRGNSQDYDSIG